MTYITLFQRWFDVVPRRIAISTQKQRWTDVEMFAGKSLSKFHSLNLRLWHRWVTKSYCKLGSHISGSMEEILLMWLGFFKECTVFLIFLGINLLSLSITFFWSQLKLNQKFTSQDFLYVILFHIVALSCRTLTNT